MPAQWNCKVPATSRKDPSDQGGTVSLLNLSIEAVCHPSKHIDQTLLAILPQSELNL